jgi:hypothetical protein
MPIPGTPLIAASPPVTVLPSAFVFTVICCPVRSLERWCIFWLTDPFSSAGDGSSAVEGASAAPDGRDDGRVGAEADRASGASAALLATSDSTASTSSRRISQDQRR